MKKSVINSIVFVCFSMFFLSNCSENSVDIKELESVESDKQSKLNDEEDKDPLYVMLLNLGYSPEQIEEFGYFYVVDGDIVCDKRKYVNKSFQKRFNGNVVTKSNIKIWLNPLMSSEWESASVEAISRWNNVLDKISFTIISVRSNADIVIQYDSHETINYPFLPLGDSYFGLAFLSNGFLPGSKVWINNDFNKCMSEELRISNVQHEIGHTLGFFHTNDSAKGEHVHGTPISDSNSLMNGGKACQLNNFTDADIAGIKMIYGSDLINVKNFKVLESANSYYNSGSKFDYEFEIKGDYSYSTNNYHQIDLKMYQNSMTSSNLIGLIKWNREDDYDIVYPDYFLKKTWFYSFKPYNTYPGTQHILKVEYAGNYKLYYHTH